MADNDNIGAGGLRKADLPVAIAAAMFECRLGLASAVMGIRTLMLKHQAEPLQSELDVLMKVADQVSEAFEALGLYVEEFFQLRSTLN